MTAVINLWYRLMIVLSSKTHAKVNARWNVIVLIMITVFQETKLFSSHLIVFILFLISFMFF